MNNHGKCSRCRRRGGLWMGTAFFVICCTLPLMKLYGVECDQQLNDVTVTRLLLRHCIFGEHWWKQGRCRTHYLKWFRDVRTGIPVTSIHGFANTMVIYANLQFRSSDYRLGVELLKLTLHFGLNCSVIQNSQRSHCSRWIENAVFFFLTHCSSFAMASTVCGTQSNFAK